MATVKKSKKRIIVPIAIVLVLAIIITSVIVVRAKNSGEQASLYTISTGDINETVSATGDVTAGATREYKVGTVANVKEVFVKTGDKVKEGDKLATFDTSNLDSQVAKLQSTYSSAKSSYYSALSSQATAKNNLGAVNNRISKLQKDIAKLQKNTPTTKKKNTTKKSTTKVLTTVPTTERTTAKTTTAATEFVVKATVVTGQEAYGKVQVGNGAVGSTSSGKYNAGSTVTLKATNNTGYQFAGWYDTDGNKIKSAKEIQITVKSNINYLAQFKKASSATSVEDLADALTQIADSIKDMTDDVNTMLSIIEVTSNAISEALANNVTNSTDIATAVQNAIIYAINEGVINEDNLNVMGKVLAQSIADAVKQINWKSIANDFANTQSIALTTKQLQLAALNVEAQMYGIEASDSAVSAKKEIMNTASDALNAVKDSAKELEAGWTASFDGTITSCDLKAGEQTSLVSDGIKLENMNSMCVTISLSEYDNHKVKIGMPCIVSTAYGKYEGEIASKAPTATGGSSSSLLDNVGSMAGVSGLSSLTDSGAGVECTVKVNKPDENIIIGFDADVEVQTGNYLGVTVVPIESIILEKTGTYVYKYNEEEKTATKTEITTGAISDTAYQVTSGLAAGDKIISAPKSDYKEDTFKVKVVDKATTTQSK